MLLVKKSNVKDLLVRLGLAVLMVPALAIGPLCSDTIAAGAKKHSLQRTFSSPEEAVRALVNAAKADDTTELSAILGPDGKQLISSGDQVADRNGRDRFVRMYEEKNMVIKDTGDKAVLEVGNDGWPFPIPIVKAGGDWRFDTKEGKREILDRRIGRNELSTIQSCLAYVDAQREYASKDRNGDGLLEYAQKFASEPGKKDGLYWESKEGEEQSPLGPLVASAKKEGYTRKKSSEKPQPYHGYLFKILTAQGKNAAGGAHDYLARGKMIGGFALIAFPAEYGSSGIMTFIVSHSGEVYEKDLGKRTRSVAGTIKAFDPDKSWRKVEPKFLEPPAKAGGD
jgi:hypothetical protein